MADINKIMSTLIPILLQRKLEQDRVKQWLDKSLKEYEAYAKNTQATQERSMQNAIYQSLLHPELFKDQPYQAQKYVNFLKAVLPQEYIGNIPPQENFQDTMSAAEEAAKRAVIAMQNSKPVSDADIGILIKAFGYKMPAENIKEVLKNTGNAAELLVRKNELTEQRRSRAQREKELKVRKDELAEKKAGKSTTKAKIESLLEKKRNERWKVINQIEGKNIEDLNAAKRHSLISQLSSINKDIRGIKKKLGTDPDEGYAKLAKALKARGFKKKDVLSNDALIAKIREQNLSPWILLEYF